MTPLTKFRLACLIPLSIAFLILLTGYAYTTLKINNARDIINEGTSTPGFSNMSILLNKLNQVLSTMESAPKWRETVNSSGIKQATEVELPTSTTPLPKERFPYPSDEFLPSRLSDMPNFSYTIRPDVCGLEDDIFMLVIVGSHPINTKVRDVIRHTWGNPRIKDYKFKLIFPFGQFKDENQQKLLEEESAQYGDILQGNFIDSYHNVTIRDLMALRYAWQYCIQARFVMKTDDDISVNVFSITKKLMDNFATNHYFLACFALFTSGEVLRSGRYAVDRKDLAKDIYDPYCSGWMYILTPSMCYSLDMIARMVRPFWMNDAFITGELVSHLKVKHQQLNIDYTFDSDLVNSLGGQNLTYPIKFELGPTSNATVIKRLHQKYLFAFNHTITTDVNERVLNETGIKRTPAFKFYDPVNKTFVHVEEARHVYPSRKK